MRPLRKAFQALADANRLRILKMLEIRSLCVCEITEILELAPSTVSKHLAILREAGLIVDTKSGKWVNYHLEADPDSPYAGELLRLAQGWLNDDARILSDRKAARVVDREIICQAHASAVHAKN